MPWSNPFVGGPLPKRRREVTEQRRKSKGLYDSPRWRRLRKLVIYRDKGLCQMCEIERGNEVDHKRPLRDGGRNELDNLQLLCSSCHSRKTGEGL